MLQERLQRILEASVAQYIASGEPVSSDRLFDEYDFGIRPAMIRNELQALTEAGYLEQPHHSAGRIPTDRGYEFYVEQILVRNVPHRRESRAAAFDQLFSHGAWDDFTRRMAHEFGVLSVVHDLVEDEMYKDGLDALVEHLDWNYPDDIKHAIRDAEELDERMPKVRDIARGESPAVFIGKKSPITKSPQLSVVAKECTNRDRDVLIVAIGPRRMPYEKVIDFFRIL